MSWVMSTYDWALMAQNLFDEMPSPYGLSLSVFFQDTYKSSPTNMCYILW